MPDGTREPLPLEHHAPQRHALAWLHIGDLHLAEPDAPNRLALDRIVQLANALPPGSLDFAVLPGDNADNGTPAQYAILREAVAGLRLPLYVLPGDHDLEPGSLDNFHALPWAKPLPFAVEVKGRRCLFLDLVSAGTGGPDFRVDDAQLDWVEREIDDAGRAGKHVLVFMHTYPADLRAGAARLRALLARPTVLCADLGHTHYNELANDGATIFMATRSTGQIEEGPVGVSIAAVDGDVVSWRFKPLDALWPFVLITSPADRRLSVQENQRVSGSFLARAKVAGDARLETVEVQVDGGHWERMAPAPGESTLWQARCRTPGKMLRVRARDAEGRSDEDGVALAGPEWEPPRRAADGSDRDSVGAWEERGILGTQLGPNRNGRAW